MSENKLLVFVIVIVIVILSQKALRYCLENLSQGTGNITCGTNILLISATLARRKDKIAVTSIIRLEMST